MLPEITALRKVLEWHIADKERQGYDTAGCLEQLRRLPDRYDAIAEFAQSIEDLPARPDWPHVEPIGLEETWQECDPRRPTGAIAEAAAAQGAARAETAFLSSVCGCVLGKPLEIDPALPELRESFSAVDASGPSATTFRRASNRT